MFVAEKVLLLLVISLTVYGTIWYFSSNLIEFCYHNSVLIVTNSASIQVAGGVGEPISHYMKQ